jgi:plastocyanin
MKKLAAAILAAVLAAGGMLAIPALGASTRTVKLIDNAFKPKKITVKKGTKVRFRWTGQAPHNVTVTKGPVTFHSSTKTSGTFSRKLTRRGTYKIICTIHQPGMKLTIRVT